MSEQDHTIDDAARILNVHRKTVERLLEAGSLKGYKVGRIWRIRPEDLREFRQRHPVKPEDEDADKDNPIKIPA